MNYKNASGLCYIKDQKKISKALKSTRNKWERRPSNGGITKVFVVVQTVSVHNKDVLVLPLSTLLKNKIKRCTKVNALNSLTKFSNNRFL